MAKNHTHKYILKNLSRDKIKGPFWVYICCLPGCTSFIRRDLVVGKENICHRCGKKHIINNYVFYRRIKKPHCENCTKFKPATVARKDKIKDVFDVLNIDQLLESIGDDE